MISISGEKRVKAMEGKGVEMEPLNKKGLLIHAFFSLKIMKISFSYPVFFAVTFFPHNLGK